MSKEQINMKEQLRVIQIASKLSLQSFVGKWLFFLGTLLSLVLYYAAIELSASLTDFLGSTTTLITSLNIAIIFLNSVFFGISAAMIYESIKSKENKESDNSSFIQVLASVFFSVASTGCYVCGSLLLPAAGITASFASLPFAGLEIKVLTAGLLLYSLSELSKNVLGTCKLITPKTYSLNLGSSSLRFSNLKFIQLKPYFITVAFIAVIYILPFASTNLGLTEPIVARNDFVCTVHPS